MPIVITQNIQKKITGIIAIVIIFIVIGSLIIFEQPKKPDFAAYETQLHEIFEDAKIQFEHIRNVTLPSNITLTIYTKQQAIDRWDKNQPSLDTNSILRQENIYKSLFLMEENESLQDVTANWIASWTAVTVNKDIYVLFENFNPWDMPNAEAILIHELTHVWQSTLPKPTTYDTEKAQNALLEGDATYMADYYKTQYNHNHNNSNSDNNDFFSSPINKLSALLYYIPQQLNFVYPNVPLTVTKLQWFPYIQGKNFVSAIINNSGGIWDRLNQCYTPSYIPSTTTQILHPNKYFTGDTTIKPIPPTLTDNDWTLIPTKYGYSSDTYGEYFIYIMLNNWLHDEHQTQTAAEGWNGDTFTYYEKDNDFLFTWNITWNNIHDASEFSKAFTDMMNNTQANKENPNQWNTNNRYLTLIWNPNTATTLIICYSTNNQTSIPILLTK